MRLTGRGKGDSSPPAPDVVLQLGDAKIPLRAQQLLDSTAHAGASRPQVSSGLPLDEQSWALEALTRMQESLLVSGSGSSSPFSPDDFHNHRSEPPSNDFCWQSDIDTRPTQSQQAHAAYYPQSRLPSYVAQQTSASAVRDMAIHKGAPNIFENMRERTSAMFPSSESAIERQGARAAKTAEAKRSRKLDLVHLLPQQKVPQGSPLLPARTSRFPTETIEKSSLQRSASFTKSLFTGKSRGNSSAQKSSSGTPNTSKGSEEVFQPKTNVRRPPQGIQNWFDAYLSSDEDDGVPSASDRIPELAAPRMSSARRGDQAVHASHAPYMSSRGRQLLYGYEDADLNPESAVEPSSTGSRQNSDTSYGGFSTSTFPKSALQDRDTMRPVESRLTQHSVLSLSSSASEDLVSPETHGVEHRTLGYRDPHNGAQVRQTQNVAYQRLPDSGAASAVYPHMRAEDDVGSNAPSGSMPMTLATRSRDKPLPVPPMDHPNIREYDHTGALRRLNGLSMDSKVTQSTGTVFEESASRASGVAHMMAVTEEEKVLLDMMRRKRAAMQRTSFTQGFQTAMQREQPRTREPPSRRPCAYADAWKSRLGPPLREAPSVPSHPREDDFRRKLNEIREDDIDELLKIQNFLSTHEHASPESGMPVELPATQRGDDDNDNSVPTRASFKRSNKNSNNGGLKPTDFHRSPARSHVSQSPSSTATENARTSPHINVPRGKPLRVTTTSSPVVEVAPLVCEKPKLVRKASVQRSRSPLSHITVNSPSSSEGSIFHYYTSRETSSEHLPREVSRRDHEAREMPHRARTNATSPQASASPLSSIITAAVPACSGISRKRSSRAMETRQEATTTTRTPEPELSRRASRRQQRPAMELELSRRDSRRQERLATEPELSRRDSRRQERPAESEKEKRRPADPRLLQPASSRASVNSASEEILAAWADLGGSPRRWTGAFRGGKLQSGVGI